MAEIVGWRAFYLIMRKPAKNALSRTCFSVPSEDWNLLPLTSFNSVVYSPLGITSDTQPEPEMNNSYGFWSFKRRSQIERYLLRYYNINMVFATVKLYGTIIEHEIGYRSSALEIVNLYSRENNSKRRGIAHRLGWPGKVLPLKEGRESYKVRSIRIPGNEV